MHANSQHAAIRRASWPTLLLATVLCWTLTAGVVTAQSADTGEIVVVDVQGDVRMTVRGEPREMKPGTLIELPASVRTGKAGALRLRQGRTTVSVAPDSQLELPAGAARGEPIERLVQPRGNAFYDVGKRGSNKLRVETPYLVAVVKGTQFSVAVQEESASVSLFEGRLEVRASDDSDVVDLHAGEIAIRHGGDRTIRVIRMDTGETVRRAEDRSGPVGSVPADPEGGSPVTPGGRAPVNGVGGDRVTDRPLVGDGTPLGTGLDVTAQQDVGVDAGRLDVATSIGLQAGGKDMAAISAGVDVDSSIDLGAGSLTVGSGASVDLGGATADLGVDAGVDLGTGTVDLGADAGVDLGGATADLGVDAGVDLGAGTVDLGANAGVDLGGAEISADLGVGLDADAGSVDIGAGADLGATDVGLAADADLGSGTLDVDLGAGSVDLGVGVDLGAGTVDLGTGPIDPGLGTDTGAPLGGDSSGGGLLGGLLGGLGGRN